MLILFAISAVSFLTLVVAALAFARHVRFRQTSTQRQDFAHHLFAAVQDQDSRKPVTVLHQNVRDIRAKKSWNQQPETVTAGPDILTHQFTSPKRF